MAGPLTLSMKELDRLQVLTRIAERRLTRRRAAGLLQIGERQVRRLYRAFVQDGAAGLVSRRRGRPSARRLPAATQERALALIRERYADFGPTFAHQKLTEEHALALSAEPLRGWMRAAGLRLPRAQRAPRGPGLSQFGRALRELNVDSICANSPQAKGRVERANGTLQDRLVCARRSLGKEEEGCSTSLGNLSAGPCG